MVARPILRGLGIFALCCLVFERVHLSSPSVPTVEVQSREVAELLETRGHHPHPGHSKRRVYPHCNASLAPGNATRRS